MNRNEQLTALHNRQAGDIVRQIVKPAIEAGGTAASVLVLLESVTAGTIHALTKIGGDEIVLDAFMKQVSDRLAALRLGPTDAKGSA